MSHACRAARGVLAGVVAILTVVPCSVQCTGAKPADPLPLWAQPVVLYLESLKKSDGGYGWPDQFFGHVTATWAVVGSYQIVGRDVPKASEVVRFARKEHPFSGEHPRSIAHAGEMKSLVFYQIQSLRWLGGSTEGFADQTASWVNPSTYPSFYELNGYPVFQEEVMGLLARQQLELSAETVSTPMRNQVAKRMRANGSFNNTSPNDGSGGHVVNTLWGLLANQYFGNAPNHLEKIVVWLRDCQQENGGFADQPGQTESHSDLYFSWAAVRALEICEATPRYPSKCVRFILRHWQDDGGFSFREGGESDPVATYYALDTLDRLGALDSLQNHLRQPPREEDQLPKSLKVFSIQLNAPGQGSPAELLRLAKSLRIHHWVTRNGVDGYREELARLANREKVNLTIDKAQEDYHLFLGVPGIGDYGRTSLILTPNLKPELDRNLSSSQSWLDYRAERSRALTRNGGMLVWNVCDNELFARHALDDSLRRGGYDLINVFHFGGWDLLVNFPWLRAYSGKIPFVALSNTQGGQAWWWADRLASFRTLYLAESPSWENWHDAVELNRVVAVRLDEATDEPLVYGGTPEIRRFILDSQDEWRWWRTGSQVRRPAVSLVCVKPGDKFEAPRPESGVILRVRTWWWTDASGYPKKQRSELISLQVDGETVTPVFFEHRNLRDRVVDCYYRLDLPEIPPGRHVAVAEVEVLATGLRFSQSIEFEAPVED